MVIHERLAGLSTADCPKSCTGDSGRSTKKKQPAIGAMVIMGDGESCFG